LKQQQHLQHKVTAKRLHHVLRNLGVNSMTSSNGQSCDEATMVLMAKAVHRFNTVRLSDVAILVDQPRILSIDSKLRILLKQPVEANNGFKKKNLLFLFLSWLTRFLAA
jgi:hypothetical protein